MHSENQGLLPCEFPVNAKFKARSFRLRRQASKAKHVAKQVDLHIGPASRQGLVGWAPDA